MWGGGDQEVHDEPCQLHTTPSSDSPSTSVTASICTVEHALPPPGVSSSSTLSTALSKWWFVGQNVVHIVRPASGSRPIAI